MKKHGIWLILAGMALSACNSVLTRDPVMNFALTGDVTASSSATVDYTLNSVAQPAIVVTQDNLQATVRNPPVGSTVCIKPQGSAQGLKFVVDDQHYAGRQYAFALALAGTTVQSISTPNSGTFTKITSCP